MQFYVQFSNLQKTLISASPATIIFIFIYSPDAGNLLIFNVINSSRAFVENKVDQT